MAAGRRLTVSRPGAAAPSPDAPPATVVVVGGGIAGLSAALALTDAHRPLRVAVLDGADRLGGKLRSAEVGGRVVDVGPDAFLARRPEAVALCRRLDLEGELVAPGSRAAFVWARGRLRALPDGLVLGVPTRLGPLARSGVLGPLGLARAAVDLLGWAAPAGGPAPVPADRAVAALTRPRLGRQVTDRLVDPLVGGIHAGDTGHMSAAAVFPLLLAAAGRRGSLMRALRAEGPSAAGSAAPAAPVFLSLRGALARLAERAVEVLAARGVELYTSCPVERLEPGPGQAAPWTVHAGGARRPGPLVADAVVLAAPAPVSARLLAPHDPGLGRRLGAVGYADVSLVTLRLRRRDVGHPLDGTGFLVPRGGGLVTACTWLTSKWPELARPDDVLLRASTGRAGDTRAGGLSDGELVTAVEDELGAILPITGAPLEAVVTRWPGAFPQYDVGHLDLVAEVHAAAARLGPLALAGAALEGVGVPACIRSGEQAARAVLDRLDAGRVVAS